MNTLLRVALAAWTLLFLAIACAPVYADSALLGALGFLTGWVLLVPWLLGAAVLGFLIWATNGPRGPQGPPRR